MKSDVGTILSDTRETFETVKIALHDLTHGVPNRRRPALRNFVVFSRAITNILQRLRSVVSDFDNWYQPYQKEMANDKTMKAFYKLRSEILKEGKLCTTSASFANILTPQILEQQAPPPKGAKAFFMGDENGGDGWEVKLPDGTVVKYYVKLPSQIGGSFLYFQNGPGSPNDGGPGEPINDLAQYYYDYLEKMLLDAERKFGLA